jgi:hypothetical protein
MPRFHVARRTEKKNEKRSESGESDYSDVETTGTENSPGNDVASDHTACSKSKTNEKEPELETSRGSFWLHDDRTHARQIRGRGRGRFAFDMQIHSLDLINAFK